MATDVRKHTVPAAGDAPRRQAILDLGLSIRDVIPVANTTARSQLISALSAAGQPPSVTNPVFVYRADAGDGVEIEYTINGSAWKTIRAVSDTGWVSVTVAPGWTAYSTPLIRRIGDVVYLTGEMLGGESGSRVFDIPTGFRPRARLAVATARAASTLSTGVYQVSIPASLDSLYISGSIPTSSPGVSLGGISWLAV